MVSARRKDINIVTSREASVWCGVGKLEGACLLACLLALSTLDLVLNQPIGQLHKLVEVDGAVAVSIVLSKEVLETAGIDLVADSVEECVQLTAVNRAVMVAVKDLEAFLEVGNLLLGYLGGLKILYKGKPKVSKRNGHGRRSRVWVKPNATRVNPIILAGFFQSGMENQRNGELLPYHDVRVCERV